MKQKSNWYGIKKICNEVKDKEEIISEIAYLHATLGTFIYPMISHLFFPLQYSSFFLSLGCLAMSPPSVGTLLFNSLLEIDTGLNI